MLALAVAAAWGLAGCSLPTTGAPQGDMTVTAVFADSQNLVSGHSVQLADVKIGSITGVELDTRTYKTKVTMSLMDGYRLPVGTSAEVAVTSLLGENFVRLSLPPGGSLSRGPFIADGGQITRTSVQPQFEQVVGQAGPLLKALAGDDVATVVNAGATALDGNGEKLNAMLAKSSDLLRIVGAQRAELGASVDRMAKLSRSLARGEDQLGRAPRELERTTRLLNENKDKILKTVENLTRMARLLNDRVLEGRVQRFKTLVNQLDPVLAQLAGDRQRLTRLINGLVSFEQQLPKATYDGQLLLYAVLKFVTADGKIIPAGSTGGGGGAAPARLPAGVQGAFPTLGGALGGGR
ncbi:virulence factor Mce family protein [Actinomadura craniellae]|uniref:Virulence factor Mce family protein n=1 Tax=Actinomadura craniellae TaxID=2231787 RepID=A0A365HCN2_9ACTN|nr:virulence factor Mce family protein [Actinomadura craniellae]